MSKEKYIRLRKGKKSSKYEIGIPYFDDDGNRHYYSATVSLTDFDGNKKLALAYAKKLRNEAEQKLATKKPRSSASVGFLYSKKFELLPMSVKTKEKHDGLYNQSISKYANVRLRDITVEDLQTCLNDFALTHTRETTKRVLSLWRQIYKTASLLELDVEDITTRVIVPKSKITKPKKSVVFELEDFQRILDGLLTYGKSDAYNNRAIWFMLNIMYYTGCRPAEALALTRSDIQKDYISINKAVGSSTSSKRVIVPTKTEASNRQVPISSNLAPILSDLLAWSKYEYLLADENGELFEINHVSNQIHLIAKKYGVHFNSYMLRHLMSSELLARGDSVIARDLLGHTSFGMTLDYARVSSSDIKKAIDNRNYQSPNFCPTFKNRILPRLTRFDMSIILMNYLLKLIYIEYISILRRFLAQTKKEG